MADNEGSRAAGAFFGRRHGKPLRPRQASAMEEVLPTLSLDLDCPAPARLADLFDLSVDAVRLEIGFGGGEHLLHESGRFPETGFIGVEPFIGGMAKFVLSASEAGRKNVRLYDDDATRLLEWLPPSGLSGIDLLYPDPWPKKRHWKRRFVNDENLDRFARVMRPGARFRFASDIAHYVNWTLMHVRRLPEFEWVAASADDWRQPYEGWPGTRYEAKAKREGRAPAYLTFVRR